MPTVEERVVKVVADQLSAKPEDIQNDTSFVNDLGADSLDQVELIMELEEEFGIEIPEGTVEKITTVGEAIKHIQEAVDSGEGS